MKEATGEVSMTVITIIAVAAIGVVATFALTVGRNWISNTFNSKTAPTYQVDGSQGGN